MEAIAKTSMEAIVGLCDSSIYSYVYLSIP